MKKLLVFSGLLGLTASLAFAEVRLPAIFSDHMVVQRGRSVPVWGWADPGEDVTVSIAGRTKKARAGADGKWMVRLSALNSKVPLELSVKGKNTLTVQDVLVGEVWLCSGQSNMALRVSAARDFEKEQAAADLPQIRAFTVASDYAKEPQSDVKGKWIVASPQTVGDFSAAAYFFGRDLHKTLHVPVGLVNSSVGGTAIELWIDRDAQRSSPELKPAMAELDKENTAFDAAGATAKYQAALAKWKKAAAGARAAGKTPARAPQDPVALHERKAATGALFNGMIAPLVPYALRGAIWYQGEANAGADRAPYYQYQLPLLIQDWRTRWGQGDFAFGWFQLPNFNAPGRSWPVVREGMMKSLRVRNTGMAITIDIGEPGNIHPKNKQEAGRRLALWALGSVYGQKGATSGPLAAGHKVKGSEIEVSFTHADGGLVAKGGELKGFLIAGADKKWAPATARIAGKGVMVSSPQVSEPVAVRYAWADNPECNLYNGAGLPASPFRTDDWSGTQP
ncbi:MAG: sialate O-acetylesterase [Acidobacteria bacterium]|nr:sialate O-acetylesterase [Acidobacteriota bacterium]